MIILGIDPGLNAPVGALSPIGQPHQPCRLADPHRPAAMADRLLELDRHRGCDRDLSPRLWRGREIFVNVNPQSTLKAGAGARGGSWSLARAAADLGISVQGGEEGAGRHRGAAKGQVQAMLSVLLPGVKLKGEDAADALAVAITHAHHLGSHR
jgi:crossover junction endodeoxyribonuclease RuvC